MKQLRVIFRRAVMSFLNISLGNACSNLSLLYMQKTNKSLFLFGLLTPALRTFSRSCTYLSSCVSACEQNVRKLVKPLLVHILQILLALILPLFCGFAALLVFIQNYHVFWQKYLSDSNRWHYDDDDRIVSLMTSSPVYPVFTGSFHTGQHAVYVWPDLAKWIQSAY